MTAEWNQVPGVHPAGVRSVWRVIRVSEGLRCINEPGGHDRMKLVDSPAGGTGWRTSASRHSPSDMPYRFCQYSLQQTGRPLRGRRRQPGTMTLFGADRRRRPVADLNR